MPKAFVSNEARERYLRHARVSPEESVEEAWGIPLGVSIPFLRWVADTYLSTDTDIQGNPIGHFAVTSEQLVNGKANFGWTGPSPTDFSVKKHTAKERVSFVDWCLHKGHVNDKDPFSAPYAGRVLT
eukprot:gene18103-21562_t